MGAKRCFRALSKAHPPGVPRYPFLADLRILDVGPEGQQGTPRRILRRGSCALNCQSFPRCSRYRTAGNLAGRISGAIGCLRCRLCRPMHSKWAGGKLILAASAQKRTGSCKAALRIPDSANISRSLAIVPSNASNLPTVYSAASGKAVLHCSAPSISCGRRAATHTIVLQPNVRLVVDVHREKAEWHPSKKKSSWQQNSF